MQFYIPNMYDGIEGRLLEPIPSYLVQQQGQGQGQAQVGNGAAGQMLGTSGVLAMQPDGSHALQQPQPHYLGQQIPQHRQHHQHRQSRGMIEDVLGDADFQGDWDDTLDNTGYQR